MYRRRGKKIYKRKRTYRRKMTFQKRVRKTVYRMADKKYQDVAISQEVGVSGYYFNLTSAIDSGSGNNQRIGNKINLRYVCLRLNLNSQNEDGIFMRVAVVRQRSAGLNLAALPTGSNADSAFIDIERFEILGDTVYSLGDADANGMNKKFYKRTFRIMKQLIYDDNIGTNQITNQIGLFLWSNDIVTTGLNVVGNVRMYYTDV